MIHFIPLSNILDKYYPILSSIFDNTGYVNLVVSRTSYCYAIPNLCEILPFDAVSSSTTVLPAFFLTHSLFRICWNTFLKSLSKRRCETSTILLFALSLSFAFLSYFQIISYLNPHKSTCLQLLQHHYPSNRRGKDFLLHPLSGYVFPEVL